LVIDEYLAVHVVLGDWPAGLPDDDLALPAARHFRLLQRIHQPGGGQLTATLKRLSPTGRQAMRYPHPEVLQVLDPRPLLDEAASIGDRYRTGGLLIFETLAAGLTYGHQLWLAPNATSPRRRQLNPPIPAQHAPAVNACRGSRLPVHRLCRFVPQPSGPGR